MPLHLTILFVAPSSCPLQIVITGVGAVTPVGLNAVDSYKAMCEGKSGIRKLPSWADEYPAQVRPAGMHMLLLARLSCLSPGPALPLPPPFAAGGLRGL